jgi:hypothetical protein
MLAGAFSFRFTISDKKSTCYGHFEARRGLIPAAFLLTADIKRGSCDEKAYTGRSEK